MLQNLLKNVIKLFKTTKTYRGATHEVQWTAEAVYILALFRTCELKVTKDFKLITWKRNKLLYAIDSPFLLHELTISVTPKKQARGEEQSTLVLGNPTAHWAVRAQARKLSVSRKELEKWDISEVPIHDIITPEWNRYPCGRKQTIRTDVLLKLKELYDVGTGNKTKRVSADRAYYILREDLMRCD